MANHFAPWLGLLLCLPLPQLCSAADIYRSLTSDGQERFASQALDSSYVLYLRDDSAKSAPHYRLPQSANTRQRALALRPLILQLAQKHEVDGKLVQAIIEVESRFNPQALSHKGAAGLMQLMPTTAKQYGVTRPHDVTQNLEAGIRYLKDLLKQHQGNIPLALAAYNAGAGAVAKHGQQIPPYKETMLYVPAVLLRMQAEQ
jgi:soluble lytic murein transglycosylase-like protein